MSNDLVKRLEEAYQRDLKQGLWGDDAIPLPDGMREIFFRTLHQNVGEADTTNPTRVGWIVHASIIDKNLDRYLIEHRAALVMIWSKTVFNTICPNQSCADAAFLQFEELLTPPPDDLLAH